MTKDDYESLLLRKKELYDMLNTNSGFMQLDKIIKAKRDIKAINKKIKGYKPNDTLD